MRIVDAAQRAVIQYCSDVCGCNADPIASLGPIQAGASSSTASSSLAGSPAVPRVQAMDGPADAEDAESLADLLALHAGRALRNAPSSGYLSPVGCCAGPVRTAREMAGGIQEQEGGEAAAADE